MHREKKHPQPISMLFDAKEVLSTQELLETRAKQPIRSYSYLEDDQKEWKDPKFSRFRLAIYRPDPKPAIYWPFHDIHQKRNGDIIMNEQESYKRAFQVINHPHELIPAKFQDWTTLTLFMSTEVQAIFGKCRYNVILHTETRTHRIKKAHISWKQWGGIHTLVDLDRIVCLQKGKQIYSQK